LLAKFSETVYAFIQKAIKMPNRRVMLIVAVVAGGLAFLFFGKRTLAETFFFLTGVVAITAFYQERQLKADLEETKKRFSERLEELEHQLEKKEEETTKKLL